MDLVISSGTTFVVIDDSQWKAIELAQDRAEIYQFTGRVPGLYDDKHESVYVRCVAQDKWTRCDYLKAMKPSGRSFL